MSPRKRGTLRLTSRGEWVLAIVYLVLFILALAICGAIDSV